MINPLDTLKADKTKVIGWYKSHLYWAGFISCAVLWAIVHFVF
jgi:hypothetical protein